MEIKKIEIKECDECPFNADTYIVSYKEIDDASSFGNGRNSAVKLTNKHTGKRFMMRNMILAKELKD